MTKFSQMHKLFIHFMVYRNLDAQILIEKKKSHFYFADPIWQKYFDQN